MSCSAAPQQRQESANTHDPPRAKPGTGGWYPIASMSWFRAILCFIMPPLAMIDQGIKPFLLTCVLTFLGWVPGVVAALIYSSRPKPTASY